MQTFSIEEAWDYINENYALRNIYDIYVQGGEWLEELEKVEDRKEACNNLLEIERVSGISFLRDKIDLLEDIVDVIQPPVLGYKYDIPLEIDLEIYSKLKEMQEEISALYEEIEEKRKSIQIEPEILLIKNNT